jgi:CHAD domain-containing protein
MLRDLLNLVTARADKLLAHLPGAADGDPRDAHQTRVAARRLTESLVLGGPAARRLLREVRDIRRALGAIREVDVSRLVFDQLATERRWPALASARVRRHLDAERARRAKKVSRALERVSLGRIRRRIRDVGEAAATVAPKTLRARLEQRIVSRRARLQRAVRRAGAIYDIDKLHDVRLAVKKLRYTLEVADDALGRRRAREISRLRASQQRLGELHDLQVLERHLAALEATLTSSRGPMAASLAAIRNDIDADCRRLHGQWLQGARQ